MLSLPCRDPAVRGYSVCWHDVVLYLHSHRHGEDLTFYRDYPPGALWVYMPMMPGEFITDIWLRRGGMTRDMALMVSKVICQHD